MSIRSLAVLPFLLISPLSFAAISASPNPNPDGNFTVSWDPHGSTDWYELKQQVNGGGWWTTYTLSATSTSKSFSSKPDGTYKYKLDYCASLGHPDEWECFDTGYGTIDVIVQPLPWPEPDSMFEQLTYEYETRTGHLNGDGLLDIFVHRVSGGVAGNGTIGDVILQTTGNGGFQSFVPNSSQLATATGWSVASIPLVLDDLNVDGFVDVQLMDVSSFVSYASALDQHMRLRLTKLFIHQPRRWLRVRNTTSIFLPWSDNSLTS